MVMGFTKLKKMNKIRPGMAEIQGKPCGRRFFACESRHADTLYMTADRDSCMIWPESLPSLEGFL
jgi:hypothetical protein